MKALGLDFEETVFPGRAEWELAADTWLPAPRLPILVFPTHEHHSSLGAEDREVNCRHIRVTSGKAPEVPETLSRPLTVNVIDGKVRPATSYERSKR